MLKPTLIIACLMALLCPYAGFAQNGAVPASASVLADPVKQDDSAWQSIRNFEETRYFAVAGPPTLEDAPQAMAETKLYQEMVDHFDELEDDDDDEYMFVVEALFSLDDSLRPASLRGDEDDLEDVLNSGSYDASQSTSIYINSVRPTFLPGMQIKPRASDPDNKGNTEARSLFSDIEKNKVNEILGDEVKPSPPPATPEEQTPKVGTINAPPKQHVVSPDEETLNQLKRAVEELGMKKHFNVDKGVDGHQVLETDNHAQTDKAPANPASVKSDAVTGKQGDAVKKKKLKPRKRVERKPKSPPPVPVPEEPKKEDSIFDIF